MSDRPATIETTDPRVLLAEERTMLAWVRTGLALMGFGFVLARFGLFLREIIAEHAVTTGGVHAALAPQRPTFSLWAGVSMILLGVLVLIYSTLRHEKVMRAFLAGRPYPAKVGRAGMIVALILAAGGIAMALYLTLVQP